MFYALCSVQSIIYSRAFVYHSVALFFVVLPIFGVHIFVKRPPILDMIAHFTFPNGFNQYSPVASCNLLCFTLVNGFRIYRIACASCIHERFTPFISLVKIMSWTFCFLQVFSIWFSSSFFFLLPFSVYGSSISHWCAFSSNISVFYYLTNKCSHRTPKWFVEIAKHSICKASAKW